MAVEWFAQTAGGTIGPITTAQLREAVARGQVNRNTSVKCGEMQRWVQADSLKGLFPCEDPAEPGDKEPSGRMNRSQLFILISVPLVGLVIALLVIVNYNRSHERTRAEAADAKLAQAVDTAEKWLSDDKTPDPEADLLTALRDDRVQSKSAGDAALQKVRSHKADVAANRLLDEARLLLDQDRLPAAAEKLREYVAGEHGTQKPAAQELLANIRTATSPDAAIATLVAMSDSDYQDFKQTRHLPNAGAHPAIARWRLAMFLAAIPAADGRREEDRRTLVERKKAEADAAAEAALEAPLDAFLGGTIRGKEAAGWRQPMKFHEVPWTKPKSEFDLPDKFESKYDLDCITLAPGVQMMLSVKNIDKFFGTEWTWMIHAASPAHGRPRNCSVAFSVDGKVENLFLDKLVDVDSPIHSYTYLAGANRAFSPVMRQIATAKTVRYKLTIGGKELEATLPADARDYIRKLVSSAKYEDRYILINGK
jgi:hypothetical protein